MSLNADDVEAYFAAKQYQRAETSPQKFISDKEVIDYVKENAGVICKPHGNRVRQPRKRSVFKRTLKWVSVANYRLPSVSLVASYTHTR